PAPAACLYHIPIWEYVKPTLGPPRVDPARLARFVCRIKLGIAVQAASGANRAQLYEIVEVAMRRCNECLQGHATIGARATQDGSLRNSIFFCVPNSR